MNIDAKAAEFSAKLSFADTNSFDPTNPDDMDARRLMPTQTQYFPDQELVRSLVTDTYRRRPGFILILEGLDRTGLGFRVSRGSNPDRMPCIRGYDLSDVGTDSVRAKIVSAFSGAHDRIAVSRVKQVWTQKVRLLDRYALASTEQVLFDDLAMPGGSTKFSDEQVREMHVARTVLTAMNMADRLASLATAS